MGRHKPHRPRRTPGGQRPARPRCQHCGKAVFATEFDALDAAISHMRRGTPTLRVYRCLHARTETWHLTRMPGAYARWHVARLNEARRTEARRKEAPPQARPPE